MKTKDLRRSILAAAMIAIIVGYGSQSLAMGSSSTGVVEARDQLVAELKQCTEKHGYDPKAAGLPENALAPTELAWRQCAYDAARKYGEAHPAVSGLYNQLISEDIEMTTAIQQGAMTRSQRRTRVEELIGQIKAAEEAQIKAAASEQERQHQQLKNVVEGARGFSY